MDDHVTHFDDSVNRRYPIFWIFEVIHVYRNFSCDHAEKQKAIEEERKKQLKNLGRRKQSVMALKKFQDSKLGSKLSFSLTEKFE